MYNNAHGDDIVASSDIAVKRIGLQDTRIPDQMLLARLALTIV